MYIRKRGKNWTVQVRLADGERVYETFGTRGLAELWGRQTEAARDAGTLLDPRQDNLTCGDQYVTFERVRRGVLAPATVAKNASHWEHHLAPAFANVPIRAIRRGTVEAWVVDRAAAGVGIPTLESAVRLFSALMESAVDDAIIVANPLRKVRVPAHAPKRRRFVTDAELAAVVAQIDSAHDRLLIQLMAGTGLRIGETLGLTAADIGPGARSVSVRSVWTRFGPKSTPKSPAAIRTVPVPEELRPALREHTRRMLPATVLFVGDDRNLNNRTIKPACEAAGIPTFTIHELRHHYASALVAGGLPLLEVAKAMGQSDTRMVEKTYAHLVPGAADRVLAARAGTLR
jgi:integrase